MRSLWTFIDSKALAEREAINAKAAHDYFNELQIRQELTPINTGGVLLMLGESAFLQEAVPLLVEKAIRRGGSIGNFYFGGSDAKPQPRLKYADFGVLVLTDQRLIFEGCSESRSLKYDEVISVKASVDTIEVSSSQSAKSDFYRVENPMIWLGLIDGMVSGRLTSFTKPAKSYSPGQRVASFWED